MKKISSCFLLLVLITSFVFAQKQKTDWAYNDLKGAVKSVKKTGTYRYRQNGKFTEWAAIKSELMVFDSKGNKTEHTFYKEDGTYDYKQIIKRDAVAKTKESGTDLPGSGKGIFRYDDNGNELEEQQYKSDGSLISKYINTHDANGNLTMSKGYKPDGSLLTTRKWKYDSKGNTIESDMGWGIDSYKYDGNGNRTEQLNYNPDGTLKLRYTFKYDDKGNKTEEFKYTATGVLKDHNTWTYEYDKQGNWIKRTQITSENEPFSIEERAFVYY